MIRSERLLVGAREIINARGSHKKEKKTEENMGTGPSKAHDAQILVVYRLVVQSQGGSYTASWLHWPDGQRDLLVEQLKEHYRMGNASSVSEAEILYTLDIRNTGSGKVYACRLHDRTVSVIAVTNGPKPPTADQLILRFLWEQRAGKVPVIPPPPPRSSTPLPPEPKRLKNEPVRVQNTVYLYTVFPSFQPSSPVATFELFDQQKITVTPDMVPPLSTSKFIQEFVEVVLEKHYKKQSFMQRQSQCYPFSDGVLLFDPECRTFVILEGDDDIVGYVVAKESIDQLVKVWFLIQHSFKNDQWHGVVYASTMAASESSVNIASLTPTFIAGLKEKLITYASKWLNSHRDQISQWISPVSATKLRLKQLLVKLNNLDTSKLIV